MYNPRLGWGTNEAKKVFLPHNLKYGFDWVESLQVMWCFRAHMCLNCYLPLCDLYGPVGIAPSCVWEVWFYDERGKNEAEKVFLTHGREYGFKCAGGLQVMWCFTVLGFFLPSTTWPVPPTLHVFFLKVKVVLVWTEHLKAWTFFWKRSKILPVPCEHSLKRCPLY